MARPGSISAALLLPLVSALTAAASVVSGPTMAGPAAAGRAEAAVVGPQSQVQATAERRRRMGAIRNWGYWLSSLRVDAVATAPHDLLVIDNAVSANRPSASDRSADEVARVKRRPDGSGRVVLAYLSIGEAERYRPYWRPEWRNSGRPAWLGDENPDWPGNFRVQYWNAEWQQLIFGAPDSYLDRIIDQGFDGIYIDRADAFLLWDDARPSARDDMTEFIVRLAAYARKRNPGFLVVMQNAEELLDNEELMGAIDGVAKEDLLFGVDSPETPNKAAEVKWSLKYLHKALRAGRKVLVVEYLKSPAKMTMAAKRIREEDFVPYFAPRLLDCLNPPATLNEAGRLPEHPCR